MKTLITPALYKFLQGNIIKKVFFLCSLGFCQFILTQGRFMKTTVTILQVRKIAEQILLGKESTLLPYHTIIIHCS